MYYYQHSIQEVLDHFNVNPNQGLDAKSIQKSQLQFGKNELPQAKPDSAVTMIFRQFKNPLIPVLVLAGGVSFVLHELIDAGVIMVTVIVNVLVGFLQEDKAQKAIHALRNLSKPYAIVLREGVRKNIESSELVPGDILILEEGIQIQADARVVRSYNLGTDESALTGESQIASKSEELINKTVVVNDQQNMVFAGTMVVRGRGRAIVTAIGKDTEIGTIASAVSETLNIETPLQRSLAKVSKVLLGLVGVIGVIVFVLGIINGNSVFEMVLFSVSLAVSILPEGLLIGVTIALAVGTTRMAKRNSVVRTLPAVETLGEVTVVAADKTGTLTYNQLHVMQVYANNQSYSGKEPFPIESHFWEKFIDVACMANNASCSETECVGDPLEVALIRWVDQMGIESDLVREKFKKISELPFSTDYRLMSILAKQQNGEEYLFLKGAPDQVIERSTHELVENREIQLTDETREDYYTEVRRMANEGLKPLVFAYRKSSMNTVELTIEKLPSDFVIIGIIGFADIIREDVKQAISAVKQAGVRVLMLTGDHRLTASAIADLVGITNPNEVLKGEDLDTLSDEELKQKIKEINVYARVTPKHKLKIVKLLQEMGEVVAMTGDGINDAPALSQADIGVAMGDGGTDVAKEASDMVLLNNNFNTIKAAIEEGRAIYENIKLIIVYLLATNVSEVVIMITSLLLKFPLPLYPTQILWHNLITDGLPNTALVFEPADPGILLRPPRKQKSFILTRTEIIRVMVLGLTMAILGLVVFYTYRESHGIAYARTVTLIFLGFSQLLSAYAVHASNQTIFKTKIFDNNYLTLGIITASLLQVFVVENHFMQSIFRTVPLKINDWLIVMALSLSIILVNEIWHGLRYLAKKIQR